MGHGNGHDTTYKILDLVGQCAVELSLELWLEVADPSWTGKEDTGADCLGPQAVALEC